MGAIHAWLPLLILVVVIVKVRIKK